VFCSAHIFLRHPIFIFPCCNQHLSPLFLENADHEISEFGWPFAFACFATSRYFIGSNLRGNNAASQRKLQLAANLLNSLIDTFLPTLTNEVQGVLADRFDPIVVGNETTLSVGVSDLIKSARNNAVAGGQDCDSSASVKYGLGKVSGLSSVIFDVELVPGSESIDMSFLGMDGATWSGTWLVNAAFGNITAGTSATVNGFSCSRSTDIEQRFTGTTTLNDPKAQLTLKLGGETSNLLRVASSTKLTTAQLEEFDFQLGILDANLEGSGNLTQFDLGSSFDPWFVNEFSKDIGPLLVVALNEVLASQLSLSSP